MQKKNPVKSCDFTNKKAIFGLSFRQLIVIILSVLGFIIVGPIIINILFNTEVATSSYFDGMIEEISGAIGS